MKTTEIYQWFQEIGKVSCFEIPAQYKTFLNALIYDQDIKFSLNM